MTTGSMTGMPQNKSRGPAPTKPATGVRQHEALPSAGANDCLEIIIGLDDFDQAILSRAVATIRIWMMLLDQRLVFRLYHFERRVGAEPHHLQRLALGVEDLSCFRLR